MIGQVADVTCDPPGLQITDYHKTETFSLVKMYSTIPVEMAVDHFGLRLT